MKTKPALYILLIALSLTTLTSCYQDLEVVSIEDFSKVSIGLQGLTSELDVMIYNPNFFPIQLKEAKISLQVREVDAGDITLVRQVKLEARDTSLVTFNVKTRDGAIIKILKDDIFKFLKGEDVPFSASGKVIGKSWVSTVEVPIEHSQFINLRN